MNDTVGTDKYIDFGENDYTRNEVIQKISDHFNNKLFEGKTLKEVKKLGKNDKLYKKSKNIYTHLDRALKSTTIKIERLIEEFGNGSSNSQTNKNKEPKGHNVKYPANVWNDIVNSDDFYNWLRFQAGEISKKAYESLKKSRKNEERKYLDDQIKKNDEWLATQPGWLKPEIESLEQEITSLEQLKELSEQQKESLEQKKESLEQKKKLLEQSKELLESSPQNEFEKQLDEELQRHKLEIALQFIFSKCIELDERKLRRDIETTYFIGEDGKPEKYVEEAYKRLQNLENYYRIRQGLKLISANDRKSQSSK